MSWLTPTAAWWLLLLPALLALYLFRPRSIRRPVPSLRLWDKLPQVDRPRARLRRPPLSLLLLMQLLLLAAGAVALARPAIESPVGQRSVILLDASGSMATASGGATRFEQAKTEARKVVAAMNTQDRTTLLRVGAAVTTACSDCDRVEFERAIADMKVGAGTADMQAALSLASGLAGRDQDNTIQTTIISDGGFAAAQPDNSKFKIQNSKFVRVGEGANNRAITALSARRPPDGRPGYAAYARVDNGGAFDATIQVTALADTVPLPARNITLAPGGHADLAWQLPAGTARFTVSLGGQDALRADDSAALFLPAMGQYKVNVISPQADLYRRALSGMEGLQPVVVTTNNPATVDAAFTIIEGRLSPTLPNGSLLLINPTGDLFPTKGEVNDIRPVSGGAGHPILSGLDLSPLLVRTSQQVEAPAWLEPVVWSDVGTPLVVAGELEGRRIVALLFDPDSSNLPNLAAFPLLMANVVDWLYPLASAGALHPGDPIYLSPGATLTTPSGSQLQVGPSGILNSTEEAGIYSVGSRQSAEGSILFSVNMINSTESITTPTDHPELNRPQSEIRNPKSEIREMWFPLAAFALTLVGLEWLFYCWKRGRM